MYILHRIGCFFQLFVPFGPTSSASQSVYDTVYTIELVPCALAEMSCRSIIIAACKRSGRGSYVFCEHLHFFSVRCIMELEHRDISGLARAEIEHSQHR